MPVAVCTRCLGIYLGAAVGAWVQADRKLLLRVLAVVIAANLMDFATEMAGLHGNWPLVRFALGGALGAILSGIVIEALRKEAVP